MYTRGDRRRVCVTAGARVSRAQYLDYLRDLAAKVQPLDVELVIAAPQEVGPDLSAALGVHAGWLPLDVVIRTCDLIVHHGGGGTALTGMSGGVPQCTTANWERSSKRGARS